MKQKENKWAGYTSKGSVYEKSRSELRGRPYSIIEDPVTKLRVIETPWKQILNWPDGATLEFWDRLQDIFSLLSDESLARYTEQKKLTEQSAVALLDFCDWARKEAEAIRMKRFEEEERKDAEELRRLMALRKKNEPVQEEEES